MLLERREQRARRAARCFVRTFHLFAVAVLLLFAASLRAGPAETARLLDDAWPQRERASLPDIGRGVAIVFSPDLSVRGNCAFYVALGFSCYEDVDWSRVLDSITRHNLCGEGPHINAVILETHGTNGNGLKLQSSYAPAEERSYIAIGALQERLAEAEVGYVILSACNSGRLLRSHIYRSLDPDPGDPLFAPATCGIINASPAWGGDPSVTVIAPQASHIESTIVARIGELPQNVQDALAALAEERKVTLPRDFAISDMLMQILVRDAQLSLSIAKPVDTLSRTRSDAPFSEALFRRFRDMLEERTPAK